MLKVLPHQIACALYIQIILNKFKQTNAWAEQISAGEQRKTLLFALKLIRDSDISWKELQIQLHFVLDDVDMSTLIKEFHNLQYTGLMDAIKSFEILLDTSNKLPDASDTQEGQGLITRSSVLGTFLRKLILEFKKMSFDIVNELRQSIIDYLNFSQTTDESGNNLSFYSNLSVDMSGISCMEENLSVDMSTISCMEENLIEGEKENITFKPQETSMEGKPHLSTEKILLSRNQVMRFIIEQVKNVENHDSDALSPDKLQEKIVEIRCLYPDIKEVYYLSFMNYLRVSESNRAAIPLQLYFDYKEFAGDVNEGDASELEKHQLKFKTFRYCALNLGIMYCHHGNYSQAMISLEECIQIAQETNDQKCLNNAMFLLSIVKEEMNKASEGSSHLKSFVADTAKKIMDVESNSNLQEIDYLGLLRYTKLQAFKGLIAPSKALAVISQIVSEVKVSNCAQLTRSSLLDFYGFKHCATVNCQIPLQNMKIIRKSRKVNSNMIKNEFWAIALCQLAIQHASENLYNEAECILSFAKTQFSVYSPYQKMIALCEMKIQFEYNISNRNLEEAYTIGESVSRIDEMEGKYMIAAVDLLIGNISSASKSLTSLLHILEKSSLSVSKTPILKTKLLTLMIGIKLLSANLCDALGLIFKLIHFVNSNNMYGMRINANICLIRCQLQMGLTRKAEAIVDKTLYEALAFGTSYQKGILFYLKAKCLMAHTENIMKNEKAVLSEAFSLLDKSIDYFSKSQNKAMMKEILYEQAFISDKLEHFQERNKISTKFRILQKQLTCILPFMLF